MASREWKDSLVDLKSPSIIISKENLGTLRQVFRDQHWGRSFGDWNGDSMRIDLTNFNGPYDLFQDKILKYSGNPDACMSICQNEQGRIELWRRFQRKHFEVEETTATKNRIHRGPIDRKSLTDEAEANYLFNELGIDMYSVWLSQENIVRVYLYRTKYDTYITGLNLVEEAYHEDLYHPPGNNKRYIWEGVTVEDKTNPVLSRLGDITGFDIDKMSIAFYNPEKLEREVNHTEKILGEIAITLK